MRLDSILKLSIILGVLFISIGDRVLPHPMSTASTQTRQTVNQFLNELFPKWETVNPNAQTEKAIKEQENESYL